MRPTGVARLRRRRILEADEESGVSRVLHTIYQRVFTSLYVLSSLLEAPYPPPDLIHSPTETRELRPENQAAIDTVAQEVQQTAQNIRKMAGVTFSKA